MTELFKCEKSKTTCCSPKSAIKEEKTRLQRIKYQIRRKDTEIQNTQFIEVRYYTVINSFIIIYISSSFFAFLTLLWIWNLLKFKYIPPLRPNMIHDTVNLSRRSGSYVNGGRYFLKVFSSKKTNRSYLLNCIFLKWKKNFTEIIHLEIVWQTVPLELRTSSTYHKRDDCKILLKTT